MINFCNAVAFVGVKHVIGGCKREIIQPYILPHSRHSVCTVSKRAACNWPQTCGSVCRGYKQRTTAFLVPKVYLPDRTASLSVLYGTVVCSVRYCAVLHLLHVVLYCTVLSCPVLYCTVPFTVLYLLYCAVLYCTVLCCAVLYCAVLCCTVLYCAVLYCAVLCCTVRTVPFTVLYPLLYCAVLCCTVMCCTVLYCTVTVLSSLLYVLP